MRKQFLLTMTFIAIISYANAQKTYWEVTSDMFDNARKYEGLTLDLGSGNKLTVYTNNGVTIGNGEDFRNILKTLFINYDVVKDSVNESIANTLHFFYNPDAKDGLTIIPGKQIQNRYIVVDGEQVNVKAGKDTVNIYPRNPATKTTSVFSFTVNRIEDLRQYITLNTINDFIENVNSDINKEGSRIKPIIKGESFHTFGFQSRFTGSYTIKAGDIEGDLKPFYSNPHNITFSAAAAIQNFKNYLAPSFNASLDFYLAGVTKGEYLRFGAYWEPVFFFDKDANEKLQTHRNDFIGMIYEYRRGNDNNKLGFYAPISIAYLVKRRGDFFEKNTFNFGIGGIKYGAMTLRPSMYFNGFLKNITPSVQLSVSWGR